MNSHTRYLFFFLVLQSGFLFGYEVIFEGIEDSKIMELVKSVSRSEKLKADPPPTAIGMKRRAEADIGPLIRALHSLAYYNAKADFHLNDDRSVLTFSIDPGTRFPFAAYNIRYFQDGREFGDEILCRPIKLKKLGIEIGAPALPETIITAEDTLLDCLNLQGFAFAKIVKRDVFADEKAKSVIVWIIVEVGPVTRMGPTHIHGLSRVRECFILKKIRWQADQRYNPVLIEKTQEALELSGLFRSVNIGVAEEPVEGDLIPIDITVLESKQHTVDFGLNFTTELGFGITGGWEDRNTFGEGRKLSIGVDLWEKLQDARIGYIIPDYGRQDQNLIWLMDWHRDRNKSYSETAFSLSGTIERKINERLRISYGGMYKFLRSMRSARNGTFDLIKIPLQLRWTNTDSILEPTRGATVQLKATPSLQILSPRFAYSINSFTGTYYTPLTKNKKIVFASKIMLGSIVGASKYDIPPPERFYAGSENSLRGYRFLTISPLGRRDKPLGGRSLLVYTTEIRTRIGDDFGLVLFYDIGNVYKDYYPRLAKPLLQSTGLGIRYYTPIGPLRLDLAFPLNRRRKKGHRKYLDHFMEAYFSIGQSF